MSEYEHDDDKPVGRILTRREVLALFGATGAAWLVGCTPGQNAAQPTAVAQGSSSPTAAAQSSVAATTTGSVPACVVRPQVTEGPYFVDERLNRSDIRSDSETGTVKEGTLLTLAFNVTQVSNGSCTPLEGAIVDIWHCDADGAYSDVTDTGVGFDTTGQTFLRGYQVTDANGQARFTTIYPGWYSGRTVHIHFKVRTALDDANAGEFTSQLFFDEALSDEVFSQPPYADKGRQDTLNSTDGIYQDMLLLAVGKSAEGYTATFDIGIDWSATSEEPGNGGPGGPPPGEPPPGGPGSPPPQGAPPS